MSTQFRTIGKSAAVETTVKKSRFIAYARPVSDEEQAAAFLSEIRKKHSDATHNCYAYVLDQATHRQSDDGEPSGTAGMPIYTVLERQQLQFVMVEVTRYFGGVMLGAGGLVRAYGEAASLAIQAAGVVEQRLHRELRVTVDYHWLSRLEHEIRARGWLTGEPQFAEQVTVCLFSPVQEVESVRAHLLDWTQGAAVIDTVGERYFLS